VPIGACSIASETLERLAHIDRIYAPMGDTTLIRGLAAEAKRVCPAVRIIGVQAENAPAYYQSWKTGVVMVTDTADTIADGLATTRPLAANVTLVRDLMDAVTGNFILKCDTGFAPNHSTATGRSHAASQRSGAARKRAIDCGPGNKGARQQAHFRRCTSPRGPRSRTTGAS
jgi:threonine dehydratase